MSRDAKQCLSCVCGRHSRALPTAVEMAQPRWKAWAASTQTNVCLSRDSGVFLRGTPRAEIHTDTPEDTAICIAPDRMLLKCLSAEGGIDQLCCVHSQSVQKECDNYSPTQQPGCFPQHHIEQRTQKVT